MIHARQCGEGNEDDNLDFSLEDWLGNSGSDEGLFDPLHGNKLAITALGNGIELLFSCELLLLWLLKNELFLATREPMLPCLSGNIVEFLTGGKTGMSGTSLGAGLGGSCPVGCPCPVPLSGS